MEDKLKKIIKEGWDEVGRLTEVLLDETRTDLDKVALSLHCSSLIERIKFMENQLKEFKGE